MRQVLETGRRREDQAALIAQLLERGVDELPRDAALGEPRERGALQIDELGMRGERRLLDVDDLRAGRPQAGKLLRERIRDRERPRLEVLVVMVLGGERRERERAAYRSLQLRPAAQLAVGEREVADERRAVRFDRPLDDRLPEVRVVVVETLERPALAVAPGLPEPGAQVVPAALPVVDHVD